MKRSAAEVTREYGPFPGIDHIHGLTYDGHHVWFAMHDECPFLTRNPMLPGNEFLLVGVRRKAVDRVDACADLQLIA